MSKPATASASAIDASLPAEDSVSSLHGLRRWLLGGGGLMFSLLVTFFGLLLVTFVNVEAILERGALAGGDRHVPGAGLFLFEIVNAEWIRGEQSVVTNVPVSRMNGIRRMIENRDANFLPIHRS